MSRTLLAAVALLAAALPLGAQSAAAPAIPARRAFAHARHIRMEFHAPSKWTIVELSPMALDGTVPAELRTSFRFPGAEPPNAPGTLTFALVSRARSGADPFGAGRAVPVALVLDDGAPVTVGAQHFGRELSADSMEATVYATMPRATFLRLTRAERATVKAGGHAWVLAPDMLEALRDLASRLSPAGFRAARSTQGLVAAAPAGDTASSRALQAGEVDAPVRAVGLLTRPAFPAGAERARRRVVFRYVVDTTGRIEPATLRGETPVADAPFIASLQATAPQWKFRPAQKGGKPVRMEVRQVYTFEP